MTTGLGPQPPRVDPRALRAVAGRLRVTGRSAETTPLAVGDLADGLRRVWEGDAADAARAEATVLAERTRAVAARSAQAARVVEAYADAADACLRRTTVLRERWLAADLELRAARARALAGPDAGLAISAQAAVASRLERELRRLEQEHATALGDLDAAQAAAVRALSSLRPDPSVRRRAPVDPATLAVAGLPLASGAVETTLRTSEARAAARQLGRALDPRTSVPVPGAPPAAARREALLAWHADWGDRLEDPLLADALVDAMGVEGMLDAAAELVDGRRGADVAVTRAVLGDLGTAIVTVSRPAGGLDTGSASRLAAARAVTIRRLDAAVRTTYATRAGTHRGSWLLGQLLAAARLGGDARPLGSGAARTLVPALVAAELHDQRSGDLGARTGTSEYRPAGALFASVLPDAPASGDALHQVLARIDDDADALAVLAADVDHPAARERRGEPMVVAEYLVRRWSVLSALPGAPRDFALATTSDLTRLLAWPPVRLGDAAALDAELRARTVVALAQSHPGYPADAGPLHLWAVNAAPLEPFAVATLLAAPASVSATIDAESAQCVPRSAPATRVRVAPDGGYEPRLRLSELREVVAAMTHPRAGREGGGADALVAGEVARVDDGRGGAVGAATRASFYDAAASLTRIRDALAGDEASADAVRFAASVVVLVRSGGRSLPDDRLVDLVVWGLHTRRALAQAEDDEARSRVLEAQVAEAAARHGVSAQDLSAALRTGRGGVGSVPDAEDLRAADRAELADALAKALVNTSPIPYRPGLEVPETGPEQALGPLRKDRDPTPAGAEHDPVHHWLSAEIEGLLGDG